MIERVAPDERHRRTGRRVDHADVGRDGDLDPLDPVLLGGDGRFQHQLVAFLDVLQRPKVAVPVGRDADVAWRPW